MAPPILWPVRSPGFSRHLPSEGGTPNETAGRRDSQRSPAPSRLRRGFPACFAGRFRVAATSSRRSLGQQFLLGSRLSGVDADGHQLPPQPALSPADRYTRHPRLLPDGPDYTGRRGSHLAPGKPRRPLPSRPIELARVKAAVLSLLSG